MAGRNRLSPSSSSSSSLSRKAEVVDERNEIDINIMEQESLPMDISANSSLKSSSIPSDFPMQPAKLSISSIAIAEKNDPRKFRIYRPLNHEQSESIIYYRCSKCESIEKKDFGHVRTKRYKPYVKTLNGKLIGNAHPEHHPNCRAITKKIQELQEMDRACRAKIRGHYMSRKSPEKLEKYATKDSSNIDVQSDYNLCRKSMRSSLKFDAQNRDINGSGVSEIDYLLRFISDACVSDIAETADCSSIYSVGTSSSNSISYSSLIVPESDGISVRIYDGDGKLTDQGMTHYHCSRCDDLYQKQNDESLQVALKAKNDLVVDYPVHHAECLPTSLESLRELGDDLKDFCVVANHRIIPLKTVLDSEYSVFHEPDETFFTGESDEQSWNTANMDDEMLINSMSVPKLQEQRCFCKRLYEENLELYQEMLRSVDEMRSLVNEMKRVSDLNTEYYIEDGQILEEGDSSTLFVIDE